MNCPHCNKDIDVVRFARQLEEERISFSLKYEGQYLEAEILGKTIANLADLLKMSAKVSGIKSKILVGFDGLDKQDKEITVHFQIFPLYPPLSKKD